MPIDRCENCNHEFAWDKETGLNVKYYEGKSTRAYFQASRVSPCCPECDSEVTPGKMEIKIESRRWTLGIFESDVEGNLSDFQSESAWRRVLPKLQNEITQGFASSYFGQHPFIGKDTADEANAVNLSLKEFMPLFLCDKCGVIENTALGTFWTKDMELWKDESLNGKALCSECTPAVYADGTPKRDGASWHGKFPREFPDLERVEAIGRENFVLSAKLKELFDSKDRAPIGIDAPMPISIGDAGHGAKLAVEIIATKAMNKHNVIMCGGGESVPKMLCGFNPSDFIVDENTSPPSDPERVKRIKAESNKQQIEKAARRLKNFEKGKAKS